jgi:uncharacterized membrane protein
VSELVVIAFASPDEADRLLTRLDELERDSLIDLDDAVIAVRNRVGRVRLKQSITTRRETRQGVLSGALFGTLIGALFLNPLAGLAAGSAIGGATGALTGSLLDFEISDDFIRDVGRSLRPNSSALFLLVRRVKPEQVLKELEGFDGQVIRSTLSSAQEARLETVLRKQQEAQQGEQHHPAVPS